MLDAEHIRDLFASFGPVTVRRLFGGAGVYADGVMFALVADAAIYLKVDECNESDFEREALPPFSYQARNGKRAVMSYRKMPERLYDDPDQLAHWAARAHAAAQRGRGSKTRSTRKAAPTKRHASRRRR
ncbi:MAG: TfoX/Sxy family protein [Pseudorhodoplanes sp.]|uniref:TfoX/Sxy family protein n=1 Tax=Pseudorhodoplanes sp. TaxID=1934341 RepID=UPI003D0E0E5A